MIKIPEQQIVSKIKEKTGISDEELNNKVQVKMDQLAGLISREGALHIIANEYNIKLLEETQGKLSIKNILTGMKNVEIVGKAVDIYEVREFNTNNRSGKVGSFIIGDETGTIRVVLWGSQADRLAEMASGDIIKVQSGYVKDNQGRQEVHLGDRGTLAINPEGEKVGEVKRKSFTRKGINEIEGDENEIEILATIVQAYNPTFFEVCPTCFKRVRDEGGYTCQEHGNVTPAYSYVLNAFLDDGSGNIRGVFFKNQANILTGKNEQEFLEYKDSPEKFEEMKHELLGKMVKIVGRSKKNVMFDRLEFTAQLVFVDPDPAKELKRLKGEEVEPEELTIKQNNEQYSESKTAATPTEPAPVVEETKVEEPAPTVSVEEPPVEEKPVVEEIPKEEPAEEPIPTEPTPEAPAEETKPIEKIEEELNQETEEKSDLVDEDILKIDDIEPIESTPGTDDEHL